jgi:glyoxylase-like metal-dependent hydrolase (beta-lactamase superfamily II)
MSITNIRIFLTHLRPVKTGKITDNLYVVKTGTVNFFIYKCDEGIICIDSGFGKHLIMSQLNRIGIDPRGITHLFLTHSDFDHAGGLALFENAKIFLSSNEEPMITRKKARMIGLIYNSKIKRTYHLLNDNDVVAVGPIKIRAIATPGHTVGSMSYLVNESILFVGDTFKLIDNKVRSLRQYINMDTEQQKESIGKLARLDNVQLACTAHTGYTKEFKNAIHDWK